MLKSVVGIDFGSTALKVVELRGTWKGFEVVKSAERRLPADTGVPCPPEETAQALSELLSAHAMKPTLSVTCTSAWVTSIRTSWTGEFVTGRTSGAMLRSGPE